MVRGQEALGAFHYIDVEPNEETRNNVCQTTGGQKDKTPTPTGAVRIRIHILYTLPAG